MWSEQPCFYRYMPWCHQPSASMVWTPVRHRSPDSKFHEAYMGPTWGQQGPGGPYVGPMKLAIRGDMVPVGSGIFVQSGSIYNHITKYHAPMSADADALVPCVASVQNVYPDSKVHGANMGPIWGRQDSMLVPWTLLSGIVLKRLWFRVAIITAKINEEKIWQLQTTGTESS